MHISIKLITEHFNALDLFSHPGHIDAVMHTVRNDKHGSSLINLSDSKELLKYFQTHFLITAYHSDSKILRA